MTQERDLDNKPRQSRQYSVWSDLRAMKFLSQVQDEMRSLEASNRRIKSGLAITIIVLGSACIALTIGLVLIRGQLQDVRQEMQQLQTSRDGHLSVTVPVELGYPEKEIGTQFDM